MGCNGECCRKFPLAYTPGELRAMAKDPGWMGYVAWVPGDSRSGAQVPFEYAYDMPLVADMLIYLYTEVTPGEPGESIAEYRAHYYTCKYLTPSGTCGIYDRRPHVCVSYPNATTCRHCGCTTDHVNTER